MKTIRPIPLTTAALINSNVAENDYALFNLATTYALGERAIYISGDNHWVIESLQNANVGRTPTGLKTDIYWLKVSNTNRWKMFDQSVNSQTQNLDSIDVTFKANGRADSLALLNINAASFRMRMTDGIDGLVYDKTYSLVSPSGITDWFDYFFEPIVRLNDYSVLDLPPYANATLQITLQDTGNIVMCGAAIVGLSKEHGATQYGMQLGITDYSVKEQDVFGNYSILERDFRRTAEMTMWVDNSYIDQLHITLSALRATPTVYIGSDGYAASIIYGFYKDFSTSVAYPSTSLCTLSLEGLT